MIKSRDLKRLFNKLIGEVVHRKITLERYLNGNPKWIILYKGYEKRQRIIKDIFLDEDGKKIEKL